MDRVDDDYYEPLIDIEMDPATEVFLGLLHDTDSANGNLDRLSIASKYLREFGVASECGLGRREPKDMVKIIEHHAEVSRQVQNPDPMTRYDGLHIVFKSQTLFHIINVCLVLTTN